MEKYVKVFNKCENKSIELLFSTNMEFVSHEKKIWYFLMIVTHVYCTFGKEFIIFFKLKCFYEYCIENQSNKYSLCIYVDIKHMFIKANNFLNSLNFFCENKYHKVKYHFRNLF